MSLPESAVRVAAIDLARPHDLVALVDETAELLEHGTLHATHPRYFGLFVPGVREAGIAGDALAAIYNPQLGAGWHAPAATAITVTAIETSPDSTCRPCVTGRARPAGSE